MSLTTRDWGFGVIEVFGNDAKYVPAQAIKIGGTEYVRRDIMEAYANNLVLNELHQLQKFVEDKEYTEYDFENQSYKDIVHSNLVSIQIAKKIRKYNRKGNGNIIVVNK